MKGTLPRTALALAVITACLAGSALAQQPQHPQQPQLRHGFWFSGGLGDGSLGFPNCSGRTGALRGNIFLGGAPGQKSPVRGSPQRWSQAASRSTPSRRTPTPAVSL